MFRVSKRFACRVVGQHRSTQQHVGKVDDIEEAKLRRRLREIAPCTSAGVGGWRTACCGARAPDGSVRRHQAEHPHQVWAMDFQFDATADGRRLKFLNVIDEHSRLCLAIRVGRRCSGCSDRAGGAHHRSPAASWSQWGESARDGQKRARTATAASSSGRKWLEASDSGREEWFVLQRNEGT